VNIDNGRIFRHQVLRVNYTTYDLRRDQDSVNPRTHPYIMLLSREETGGGPAGHPYWYARIIGIYHTFVTHSGPHSRSNKRQRMDFLHVRWLGDEANYNSGWKIRRLHRLCFLDSHVARAFGFVDPSEVIRGVHLIPAFEYGRTKLLLPRSIARPETDQDEDWAAFYVNS
jgi:hypothetical protein